jgi:aminopeptidase N
LSKSQEMKRNLLFLLTALVGIQLSAQVRSKSYLIDPQWAVREHNVDFKHMKLDVSFDPSHGLVKGKVTHLFSPLRSQVDSVWLDAPQIEIKEVVLNGKSAKFRLAEGGLYIYPSSPLAWNTNDSMTITYEAHPRKGLYFIGWKDSKNISRKQIWSQGQGIDNRCWIPMYDEMNDKMTTELLVTFDKDYKVLSNGAKISEKENKDGTKTWHYRMSHPHAPYLVMLGIGKYDIKETHSKSGVPMHLYYYPEWKDRVEATYKYAENMVDFYEKETGVKYGWEGYSQLPVQDYMFGAMENTTATVYGDFYFVDNRSFLDRPYVGVNAHELAHQWFGDLVTARSDSHHWLQESFATYCNEMFEREVFGQDYFDWARRDASNKSLDESVKNKFPIANSEAGSVRHYPKGAFVLNMLKYVCGGREAYNKAIHSYLEKHKYENVDSHDLLISFEETLGFSLDWFWEEWVLKGGEPDYHVSFHELPGYTEFSVAQAQELSEITGLPTSASNPVNAVSSDPFVSEHTPAEYRSAGLYRMPIWFEVHYADGSADKKLVWVEKQTENVRIPNPGNKKVAFVLFDPNNEILKSVTFLKTFDQLSAQALKAEHMLDRYDAVGAMRSIPVAQKRDVLLKVFARETFHAVKVEIIAQLATDTDPATLQMLKAAIHDKQTLVRRAVLQQVHGLRPELIADAEQMLRDSSYETIVLALDILPLLNPDRSKDYLEATKGVQGTLGRNVEVKWLEVSYNLTGDKQYADKLVSYCSNSYEFRTRVNAAQAIKRLNYYDPLLIEYLVDAVQSQNGRLAGPCGETLKAFYEMNKYRKNISDYVYSQKLEGWQLSAVRKYVN